MREGDIGVPEYLPRISFFSLPEQSSFAEHHPRQTATAWSGSYGDVDFVSRSHQAADADIAGGRGGVAAAESASHVVYKGIGAGMFLVGRTGIPAFFLPLGGVDGGEPYVGPGGFGVYFCQAQLVGQGEGLAVEAGAADDVDMFIRSARGQGFVQGGKHLRAGQLESGLGGEDDVAAVGQSAFGQGFECLAAHQDGVARGEGFEAFQVVGQPEKQLVLVADGTAAVDGGDEGEGHVGNRF